MRKQLIYCFIAMLSIGLWSCDDDENYDPAVAIKSVSIVPYNNTVDYLCTGNYNSLVLNNENDKVDFYVDKEDLKKATMTVSTTLGLGKEINAFYNGELIGEEGVTVDATQPFQVEVRRNNQSKIYTVTVEQATSIPENEHLVIKSTNMRKVGLDPNTYSYDVTSFNGRLYCFTSATNGVTADYRIFSSEDGVIWDEVNYGPNTLQAVGGSGTKLVVNNNRLYALGGARIKCTDKWGNAPENNWGMPDITYWRSFSTADGQTFQCDTIGTKGEWGTSWDGSPMWKNFKPYAVTNADALTFNGKMYLKGGAYYGFGMLQNYSQYLECEDGTNWKSITINSNANVDRRVQDAFFVFKGKMWSIGGFTSWINSNNIETSIYSSTDGKNWTLEAESAAFGKMWGMKVVANENVAYMIGGEYLDESGMHAVSDKIYRSIDGIHWEAVSSCAKYVARRCPSVTIFNGYGYIFGGYSTVSGSYGAAGDSDLPLFDTYMFELK